MGFEFLFEITGDQLSFGQQQNTVVVVDRELQGTPDDQLIDAHADLFGRAGGDRG